MKVNSESEVAQSCPTLSDPIDCSLPGSSVHGVFQARVLEWGAIAFYYRPLTGRRGLKAACMKHQNHWTQTPKLWMAQFSIFLAEWPWASPSTAPHPTPWVFRISLLSSAAACLRAAPLEEGVSIHPLAPTSSPIQLSVQNFTSMNAKYFGKTSPYSRVPYKGRSIFLPTWAYILSIYPSKVGKAANLMLH